MGSGYWALLGFGLLGCSVATNVPPARLQGESVSSSDIITAFHQLPQGVRDEAISEVGGLSLLELYDSMYSDSTDNRIRHNGVASSSLSEIQAMEPLYVELNTNFGSVKDLWQFLHLDPETVTAVQLQALLSKSPRPVASGLGLLDGGSQATYIWQPLPGHEHDCEMVATLINNIGLTTEMVVTSLARLKVQKRAQAARGEGITSASSWAASIKILDGTPFFSIMTDPVYPLSRPVRYTLEPCVVRNHQRRLSKPDL